MALVTVPLLRVVQRRNAECTARIPLAPVPVEDGKVDVLVSARYVTPEAYEVADETRFTFRWHPETLQTGSSSWEYLGKVYHGSSGYGLRTAGAWKRTEASPCMVLQIDARACWVGSGGAD